MVFPSGRLRVVFASGPISVVFVSRFVQVVLISRLRVVFMSGQEFVFGRVQVVFVSRFVRAVLSPDTLALEASVRSFSPDFVYLWTCPGGVCLQAGFIV